MIDQSLQKKKTRIVLFKTTNIRILQGILIWTNDRVCLLVRRQSENLPHFHLLLRDHRPNFNQIDTKS